MRPLHRERAHALGRVHPIRDGPAQERAREQDGLDDVRSCPQVLDLVDEERHGARHLGRREARARVALTVDADGHRGGRDLRLERAAGRIAVAGVPVEPVVPPAGGPAVVHTTDRDDVPAGARCHDRMARALAARLADGVPGGRCDMHVVHADDVVDERPHRCRAGRGLLAEARVDDVGVALAGQDRVLERLERTEVLGLRGTAALLAASPRRDIGRRRCDASMRAAVARDDRHHRGRMALAREAPGLRRVGLAPARRDRVEVRHTPRDVAVLDDRDADTAAQVAPTVREAPLAGHLVGCPGLREREARPARGLDTDDVVPRGQPADRCGGACDPEDGHDRARVLDAEAQRASPSGDRVHGGARGPDVRAAHEVAGRDARALPAARPSSRGGRRGRDGRGGPVARPGARSGRGSRPRPCGFRHARAVRPRRRRPSVTSATGWVCRQRATGMTRPDSGST